MDGNLLAWVAAFRVVAVSAVWLASSLNAAQETTGILEGIVRYRGEIPKSSIPDDGGNKRDLLRVDPGSSGLENVVVWIAVNDSPAGDASTAVPPNNADTALMDQRDHEFVPRVLAVRSRQAVKFTNSDPANHNVRTSSPLAANEFNVFTGADGSYTHRFVADPQQRPVRVGCDIHPWMRGWIYVFDHPYFSVSDARGRFRIPGVAGGDYTVVIRQPDISYATERKITIEPGKTVRLEFELGAKDIRRQ